MEENQVKKIIEYLNGKIASLKEKLKQYDSPIMQDMAKNSPHLQMDYIRIASELQANEDNLLAIKTFTAEPVIKKPSKKADVKKD
jgi:hypothetical protein